MNRLLVTGANGFIGASLCEEAVSRGFSVRGATRASCRLAAGVENMVTGQVDAGTVWDAALEGVGAVIHLAARVHIMHDKATEPLAEFLRINLHGTVNLARQAVNAGVKRFVYVSTIKVNGEQTTGTQAFNASDEANPRDPYAISKWRAELALREIEKESGMEVVIVRPPLVYGPGVKGNFIRLLKAVDMGIPLPFANVHNARSLLCVDNLVDALLCCATHPAAGGKTYLLRDGEDISMPDLVRLLGEDMKNRARRFSLPLSLLSGLAASTGHKEALARVAGSLRVDDAPIRRELGWNPVVTLQEGLRATAAWYKEQQHPSSEPPLPKRRPHAGRDYRVSIVLVNYNAGKFLLDCVASVLPQAGQIIVVDNASHDGSIAALKLAAPAVEIIVNEHNLGFAKACNQGARLAEGEHILFLNPDCLVDPGAIEKLLQAAHSEPHVGMVGGLLTNPDGSEQVGARRAVPTPWRSFVRASGLGVLSQRYPRLFSDFALHKQPLPDKPIEVEAISGACMLARRDAIEQVGLLDEGYFMHCEDLDWCMRFRQFGWKLLFVPDARIVHHKGYSSKSRPIFVEWNKHKGMKRFYRKFFRRQYPGILMWLVTVGVWMRFGIVSAYHLTNRMSRWARPRRD